MIALAIATSVGVTISAAVLHGYSSNRYGRRVFHFGEDVLKCPLVLVNSCPYLASGGSQCVGEGEKYFNV